ncbi:MAG: hypothetical protein A2511_12760 [Deltaproteobacteria bacterium RIFOXYD12_FULL_50_9]|nr:MAG: hypothetical protein A2511_12760 [Deltaproteobacteria bacterium RIFOXYD12_FULL_50_9]
MGSTKDKKLLSTAGNLRSQAEAQLQAKKSVITSRPPNKKESQRLVHELEVHQIELEMQNTELVQARDEVETALDNYTDLYDFAPVGYLTIDHDGMVHGANFTAAGLLGIERSRLVGRRFGLFVADESRLFFSEFMGEVFASPGKKSSCEVALVREGNSALFVQLDAVASRSGQECRIAVIDITERRQAEAQIQRYVAELQGINDELTRFSIASVKRELRMIELKKEINELYIQSGRPSRYPLEFEK